MPVNPALRRLRQKDSEFKTNLDSDSKNIYIYIHIGTVQDDLLWKTFPTIPNLNC
jgi:hypothetical protein